MSHHQLENDLTHLERSMPNLCIKTLHGHVYWRDRVTALKAVESMLPDGALRITRLLTLLGELRR